MNEYIIQAMKLQNFCGIQQLEMAPGGDDLSVYGDNATGKTTIANAFAWLFTGKNASGTADFDPAPLHLDHRLDRLVVGGDDLDPAVVEEDLARQRRQFFQGLDVVLQQSPAQFLAAPAHRIGWHYADRTDGGRCAVAGGGINLAGSGTCRDARHVYLEIAAGQGYDKGRTALAAGKALDIGF